MAEKPLPTSTQLLILLIKGVREKELIMREMYHVNEKSSERLRASANENINKLVTRINQGEKRLTNEGGYVYFTEDY